MWRDTDLSLTLEVNRASPDESTWTLSGLLRLKGGGSGGRGGLG